jgi:hypothetical protein
MAAIPRDGAQTHRVQTWKRRNSFHGQRNINKGTIGGGRIAMRAKRSGMSFPNFVWRKPRGQLTGVAMALP